MSDIHPLMSLLAIGTVAVVFTVILAKLCEPFYKFVPANGGLILLVCFLPIVQIVYLSGIVSACIVFGLSRLFGNDSENENED